MNTKSPAADRSPLMRRLSWTMRAIGGGWIAGIIVYFVLSGGIVRGLWSLERQPIPAVTGLIVLTAILTGLASLWSLIRGWFREPYVYTHWSAAIVGASAATLLGLLISAINYLETEGIGIPVLLTLSALGMCGIVVVILECEAAWLSICRNSVSRFSLKLVAASAQLAKKQAELATLNTVTLPKLYHAIGKRLKGSKNLLPDLVPHQEKIHELEAAIATKPEESKPEPASDFAAKAKQLAQQAASKTAKATADAAASIKLQAAYVAFGRQAIEKYGQKALPQDLREQYEAAMQKQATLADEIGGLKSASGTEVVTPGRLAVVGCAACALVGFWALSTAAGWLFSRPEHVPVATTSPRQETSAQSAPAVHPPSPAASQTAAGQKLRRFEAECEQICSEMLAAYRAVSNSPRDIVVSAGEKLEELGRNPDQRMNGRGISAGCARATMTYLGMCGFMSLEAAARCVGQELPDGGMVGMVDSMLTETDDRLRGAGNAEEYWTHMALVRASIKLYADTNTFNADFERQLIEGGAQPAVIQELRRMRRDILSLLMARYSAGTEYALGQYGAPPFSER